MEDKKNDYLEPDRVQVKVSKARDLLANRSQEECFLVGMHLMGMMVMAARESLGEKAHDVAEFSEYIARISTGISAFIGPKDVSIRDVLLTADDMAIHLDEVADEKGDDMLLVGIPEEGL